jgi:hypothetical protein
MRVALFALISIILIKMGDSSIPLSMGGKDEAANHTFVEDFFQTDNNIELGDVNSEHLELAFTIPNTTNDLSTADFYSKVFKNLKQKYAKLEKLKLRGGYIFNGEKSSDALKTELNHLIETLKTIDKVVNENGICLRQLILSAVLTFENAEGLNISEILKTAFPEEELLDNEDTHWKAPFKIQHGRGLLKLSLSTEKQFTEKSNGRTRYFPVPSGLFLHRGPGPMIGSASYDPKTNTTDIWSAKSGHVKLEGNHMNSEELESYYPRNFDGE